MNELYTLLSALSDGFSEDELQFADIASDLAAQITARRVELGLTQQQFAQLLGKSQATISKWESADCNFQLKTLIEISHKLSLPLTVSLQEVQTKPETYILAPTPAATAAMGRYTGVSGPCNHWMVRSKA